MRFPFEVEVDEVEGDLDRYVDAVFGALESEFLVMPKGAGFVEFEVWDDAYEALKRSTKGFREASIETLMPVVLERPICLIVLRCMLGFTPPEWAYHASQLADERVTQSAVRALDREIRMNPGKPISQGARAKRKRIQALVDSACYLLRFGAVEVEEGSIHRLEKVDTKEGLVSVAAAADLGVPYAAVLYERLLGRPFASHRDSVSELVGDILENAIEEVMSRSRISYRKTKRAERLPGFDQTPDFVVPNEHNAKPHAGLV